MSDYTKSNAALKACQFLIKEHGYVVVCILPSSRTKCPKGMLMYDYATVSLIGWQLKVTAQTRAADFITQCAALWENKLLHSPAKHPREGCRFFRCVLELEDDVPF